MPDTVLFPSAGRSNYRIPSIVVTNRGTILAFVNDRRDTLSDHAQESWLVMRRKVCLRLVFTVMTCRIWTIQPSLRTFPKKSCVLHARRLP